MDNGVNKALTAHAVWGWGEGEGGPHTQPAADRPEQWPFKSSKPHPGMDGAAQPAGLC